MRSLTNCVLLFSLLTTLFAQETISKCSVGTRIDRRNLVDICDILSKPEQHANRLLIVRARYIGNFEGPATLFSDDCGSKRLGTADPEDLEGANLPRAFGSSDSENDKQNRRAFYALGAQMCPGYWVGDFIPVEATFTGVLMVKRGFRIGKNGTGNGFGRFGSERIQFVIRSVAAACRVNDCP